MRPTAPTATPTSTPKTGPLALLAALFSLKGTSTPKTTQHTVAGAHTPTHTTALATMATIAATLLAGGGLAAALPAGASAYATPAPENVYSSASGLPDGRIYEQASPTDDDGNEAGASSLTFTGDVPGTSRYGLASAEGNSVLFEATGPMGEASSPNRLFFVATRTSAGWKTRSVEPRPQQWTGELGPVESANHPVTIYMSQDFSEAAVGTGHYTLAQLPGYCPQQVYLAGSDPFVAATWLSRPQAGSPSAFCDGTGSPVGGSPNLSTVYFTDSGALLPADASRAPHQGLSGFYEYSEGALREAGVLPDGLPDAFGAAPAGDEFGDNGVSADGRRAFFVSPQPESCEQAGGHNNCAINPPELYVRESGTKTLLVSKDTLLPEADELPASAPSGVTAVNFVEAPGVDEIDLGFTPYVFASSDGSQAFFQSEDQLTADAPEGPPGNSSAKTYDFDVNTGALTYLPDVVGRLVGADTNGSTLVFVSPASESAAAELKLWSAGPAGGSVTPIVQLPGGANIAPEEVEPVRVSSDGSAVVFSSASVLPGFNDGGSHISTAGFRGRRPNRQIYRYGVSTNTLACVSCAQPGVAPGTASMSILREGLEDWSVPAVTDERGMSADGDRVFFQTQTPLVPQDTNTGTVAPGSGHNSSEPQGMDVYEWENGVVYLISSGESARDSFFLDNSETGDDVFFATVAALTPGHTDNGYAVYDARVPRAGDTLPPTAVPCEGSVCQGPANVPSPLTPPASATFSGLGNPVPEVTPPPSKAARKAVKCKKGFVKKKNKCVKRPKAAKSAKGRK